MSALPQKSDTTEVVVNHARRPASSSNCAAYRSQFSQTNTFTSFSRFDSTMCCLLCHSIGRWHFGHLGGATDHAKLSDITVPPTQGIRMIEFGCVEFWDVYSMLAQSLRMQIKREMARSG
jgi:hypothetical protein